MKYIIGLFIIVIFLLVIPVAISQPSFNGDTPGCSGSGCHSFQSGIVSAGVSGMDVTITLSGNTADVAGELVDSTGTVVAVNNLSTNNPFILTAPGPGTYRVDAGYKSPSRVWDSILVTINVTGIKDEPTNPSVYKLFNNYPNPFNPSTVIRYSLPEASFTTLKVYDALGNEVAVLVNELKNAGSHQLVFNAQNLTSGIYFYSIEAGSFRQTKKMILMK